MQELTLNNKVKIPTVGLGTSRGTLSDVEKAVKVAVSCGYRHIDCARMYENEEAVGEAIQCKIEDGTVTRKDLFVTSKLGPAFQAPEHVEECLDISLKSLKLEYVDLYLMHWPFGWKYMGPDVVRPRDENGIIIDDEEVDYVDTWKVLEKLYKSGKARAIGVSNFNLHQLNRLLQSAEVIPAVHQIECHPYLDQTEMIQFCKSKGIVVTAYSPFASPGRHWVKNSDLNLFDESTLLEIAAQHDKTVAEVVIRYLMQLGISIIPKSVTEERIRSNFQVFDFSLSSAECQSIKNLNRNTRIMPPKSLNFHKHKYFPFSEDEMM